MFLIIFIYHFYTYGPGLKSLTYAWILSGTWFRSVSQIGKIGEILRARFWKFPMCSNIGMLYIISSAFLSRFRILMVLKFFPHFIKVFYFKMTDFLTKIIRKSGIHRRKSCFFWKLLNPFLFYFIKNTIITIIRFLHQMKDHCCSHFQLYIHFRNCCIYKIRYSQFLISNKNMLLSHTSKLKKEKSLSLSF